MPEINDVFSKNIIDNRYISMTDAFEQILPLASHVDIAVGYFFLSGFDSVEDSLIEFMDHGQTIRILMGNITNLSTGSAIDEGYALLTKKLVLDDFEKANKDELSLTIAKRIRQWIAEGKLEVKIYTGDANYFHAKSYLFYRQGKSQTNDGIAIVGSSNFTKSGFSGNTELNSLSQDNFSALSKWYRSIWNGEEVSDFSKELLNFIDDKMLGTNRDKAFMHPKETYLLFSRYFSKRLPKDIEGEFMESLYKHQKAGVAEIKYRLDEFGTAILADGVGLGKTRTAAASICATNSEKTLIVASKKLHDQWEDELIAVGVPLDNYSLVSKEEVSRLEPKELSRYMNANLIIVDEAHQGLKNSQTKLYRNLSYMNQTKPGKIKGLLLTATPWNNSRSDVFNLGRLFLRVKNIPYATPYFPYLHHAPRKAAKIIENDDRAFHAYWRDLFLQRTKRTYGGNDVKYAERKFPTIEINYEPQKEKAFLANSERINRLKLPYMNPIRYLKGEEEGEFTADRLKILFLKRADSSWQAFKDTLKKVQSNLEKLSNDLSEIRKQKNVLYSFQDWLRDSYNLDIKHQYEGLFDEMDEDELTEALKLEQLSLRRKEKYKIRLDNKIESIPKGTAEHMMNHMEKHVKYDLEILAEIIGDLGGAFERKDEKYEKVSNTIYEFLSNGEKVLLISQFRSTVVDYYERFLNEKRLNSFRLAQVSGQKEDWYIQHEPQDSKETILEHFSPRSKNKEEIAGTAEEIDLLIGTETLSVGQNLQDCRVILNLDLPYNPMNLEQRIGRIDRPREAEDNGEIHVITFPSMPVIESELKMSERLKVKLEGIYSDTKFDDLVLPEYQDFLQRVMRKRSVNQEDMEEMLDDTLKSTVVNFSAEEHSAEYTESQLRMRRAIEENTPISNKSEYSNCSFSKSADTTLIAKVKLRDVNGTNIDDYLIHLIADENNINKGLVEVENAWHAAINQPLLYNHELTKTNAEKRMRDIKEFIQTKVLTHEVDNYNQQIVIEKEVDDNLIDNKVQRVIVDINEQIRGRNQKSIISKIKSFGYEPKSVKTLVSNLRYIDRNYELDEMDAVVELYENIELLWDDYKSYYELFTRDSYFEEVNTPLRNSIRRAAASESEIELITGNIAVSN